MEFYKKYILENPKPVIAIIGFIILFMGFFAKDLRLDASAESLVLENDSSLKYYREITERYGSDEYLVITYTPNGAMFSDKVFGAIKDLREDLRKLKRVGSVTTMLDVPLINSPPVPISELRKNINTLENKSVDKQMAQEELVTSPLYSNLIISGDARTTAILVLFQRDLIYETLRSKRNDLIEKQAEGKLFDHEKAELKQISKTFNEHKEIISQHQRDDIVSIRAILGKYKSDADLFLGGIPMIASDSIGFIKNDIRVFGGVIILFIIGLLAVYFRCKEWVILPLLNCAAVVITTIGIVSMAGWPVTVVSSNFIAILLIITLSITIHIIVNYRETALASPNASHKIIIANTIQKIFLPCFYTAITTIVAFISLLASGIKPVMDFGWIMTIGIVTALIYSFTIFPCIILLTKKGKEPNNFNDITTKVTEFFSNLTINYDKQILKYFCIIFVISIIGIANLTVENRFIDYYKKSTEIYQGMETIDKRLGGTTPLDIIIDAPKDFTDDMPQNDKNDMSSSYWLNVFMLEDVEKIHKYLESLSQTGKVLSINTAIEMIRSLEPDTQLDNFYLSVLYKKLPDSIKDMLFTPYISNDGNQIRFSTRVFESDYSLKRQELIEQINHYLVDEMQLEQEQIHLTGMLVLYNNLLQSLFKSQIMTLGFVFLSIFAMFTILFKNVKLAAIAMVPNVFSAFFILGIMGIFGIALDIMTITIAAICIGIAVDNTIHYIYRFLNEFKKDESYKSAAKRSHLTIGRAMYYTSTTITLGFSILILSNFMPTIYFGILTGLSMIAALIADMTLLPLLIIKFKPLKNSSYGHR